MIEIKKEFEDREDDVKRLEKEVQKLVDETMEMIEKSVNKRKRNCCRYNLIVGLVFGAV